MPGDPGSQKGQGRTLGSLWRECVPAGRLIMDLRLQHCGASCGSFGKLTQGLCRGDLAPQTASLVSQRQAAQAVATTASADGLGRGQHRGIRSWLSKVTAPGGRGSKPAVRSPLTTCVDPTSAVSMFSNQQTADGVSALRRCPLCFTKPKEAETAQIAPSNNVLRNLVHPCLYTLAHRLRSGAGRRWLSPLLPRTPQPGSQRPEVSADPGAGEGALLSSSCPGASLTPRLEGHQCLHKRSRPQPPPHLQTPPRWMLGFNTRIWE